LRSKKAAPPQTVKTPPRKESRTPPKQALSSGYFLTPPPGFDAASPAQSQPVILSSFARFGSKVSDFFQTKKSLTSPENLLPRILRCLFLDGEAYRAISREKSMTTESCVMAAVGLISAQYGGFVIAAILTRSSLKPVAIPLLVLAAAFLAFAYTASLLSKPITGCHVDSKPMIRAVGYAQSAGLLGLIPIVGLWLSLWLIATTTIAVKAATGAGWRRTALLVLCSGAATYGAAKVAAAIIPAVF
jgi:hypothetical protein